VKRALYIGIFSEGSTSKMRGEKLKSLLPGWQFDVIDTDIPFSKQPHLFRSLGFRYKTGPVIMAVNQFILENLSFDHYKLVWIDKGIFLKKSTIEAIRSKSEKLIHYTPDTAFYGNRSVMFNRSIDLYDYLITTKSFELQNYRALISGHKIILTTQGFDSDIHTPSVSFESKHNRVAFVGLGEKYRERIIQNLLDNQINVALAGHKWNSFVNRNRKSPFLDFKGTSLWNQNYVSLISSSYFALGLLSKNFPELHTTRTLEIPACGTALLTEKNEETSAIFSDQQAIFYKNFNDLVSKINYYQQHLDELSVVTNNGLNKVRGGGLDYISILDKILKTIL